MTHRSFALASVVAAVLAVGAVFTVSAQDWKTKAPTAADWAAMGKLPDFNGVWEAGRPPAAGGAARGAAPQGGARAGAAPRGGAAAAGRAGGAPAGPQLTPAYAAKRQELVSRRAEDNESANCLPPGMPGIMGQPYPMEFLVTPGKVTIVIEAYTQVRHIYTDGRPLPADPDPKFFGTSVGRWDNGTLVVETVGFSPSTTIERGVPHTDQMKFVHRLRLAAPDPMTIETTIPDPVVLASPYTTSRTLRRHREWTIAEYICEENNRNFVDQSGKAGIKLASPGSTPKK